MARELRITMAARGKIPKDWREALRDVGSYPAGKPQKTSVRNQKPLLSKEAQELQSKKQPLFIKKEPIKLNNAQIEKIAAQISRERGISISKAKEVLWSELKKAPSTTKVNQPTILSKKIPTRQEVESAGRVVKYKGQEITLTPGQLKKLYPESSGVKTGNYERLTGISPEARAALDRKAAAEAERLRAEAMQDWKVQSKAAEVNPRVRKPAEALNKPSPVSAKAEQYAQRLMNKAYRELSPLEKKTIKIIIEEEARLANKATTSSTTRRLGMLGGGFGGGFFPDQLR